MSIEAFIKRLCKSDTVVYWASPSEESDGSFGFDAGAEITCFWKEETEVFTDANGKEMISNAMVYVEQDLDEQGMIFHGALTDLTAGQIADPKTVQAAYEIKKFIKLESMYQTGEYKRTAMI